MMTSRHVLILGGTGDARQIAGRLVRRGDLRVTLSLAGRTETPLAQAGDVRTGGFGGTAGLMRYLRDQHVDLLLDATHPFAARISANAVAAAADAGVPLVVLDRPAWNRQDGDVWIEVDSVAAAAAELCGARRTVFLAIGRQELAPFQSAPQHRYVVRSVDAADTVLPDAEYILARGPYGEAEERELLIRHGVDIVVAKNSGGDATYGKIAAARSLALPVIMVRRRPGTGVPAVGSIDEAVAAIGHALGLPVERGE
jgi:precorrin-6A/cobalt-precorrin-6A reductase